MAPPKRRQQSGLRYGEGSYDYRGPGKYQARWFDGTRRRAKTFTAATDDEALELARDHVRAMARRNARKDYVPPEDMTVADLVEDWLARGDYRWKPVTVATYSQRAEAHVLPSLGGIPASELSTHRIQSWIDGMVQKGLAPSTIDSAARVLSGAYREAMRLGVVETNPVSDAAGPSLHQKRHTTWTAVQVQAVLRLLADDPKHHALYRLALSTGARPGELRALQWRDIDIPNAQVTIRRTMSKDADGHISLGDTTKSGKDRSIALTMNTLAALRIWRTQQESERLAAPHWNDLEFVFTGVAGDPLSPSPWQRKHLRIIRDADVPNITLHELRHTAATIMLEQNVHPKIVQEMLGHRKIETTLNIYSHVRIDLQRQTVDMLDALFDELESGETTASYRRLAAES